MKILLLEDDILLNESIATYLSKTGHCITSVRDGSLCLEILEKERFDLLVFDINVPNVNGLSILETLHAHKKIIPVIFISALIDIEDISRAFELGCFDYLKKPFHLKELTLRIDRISKTAKKVMCHKRLSSSYNFNCENMTLYFHDEPQVLSKRQLKIIEFLTLNRGFVCSYDMFRESVWDDVDTYVDDATIRTEVNRLKTHLKEDFILNIRGIGYTIKVPTP
ncbi:response regulator transcription factor [Sulfurospirillum barnesii]|uniref:Response regulator with CheY-like receiver domain and winged-helix DNA-binding domain n=1 Tax=Sulfurospirillum barnesii (strain ATCC 700032 / DSM 10660 / SES-3) TaxID=760154 RepID=I3XXZ1_SULBS|nr:response regulator transcription factor [Sulfurospirillum barnesii]AFL68815.1 response regulator with CheY-like receiver domain and winged-helix DNA-binding domain [Sulfurospirillum barnesii SES-3]